MSGFQRQIMWISISLPSRVRCAINQVHHALNLVKLKPSGGRVHWSPRNQNTHIKRERDRIRPPFQIITGSLRGAGQKIQLMIWLHIAVDRGEGLQEEQSHFHHAQRRY